MAMIAPQFQPSMKLARTSLRNDRVVYVQDDESPVYLSQVLQLIFGDRLTLRPRRSFERGRAVQGEHAPGWVHLGVDKSDLSNQRKTTFVRTYSTMLHYLQQGYAYMTYGTFRTKTRRSQERNRRNLNTTHAFVIDIDSKSLSAAEILRRVGDDGFLPPSFINETDRGYHVWYVLSNPVVGPHERINQAGTGTEVTRAGQFYMDMNRFLNAQFQRLFPGDAGSVDDLVGGERYIRIPQRLQYFSGHTYSILDFPLLREELYLDGKIKKNTKRTPRAAGQSSINRSAAMKDPAYVKLMNMEPKEGHRRYTAFTIALLHFALNIPKADTSAWLRGWYERLAHKKGLPWREVEGSIEMAYSGKFKGPHHKWMLTLTGMKATTYITRRKNPEERVYKTLSYWQGLFLDVLKAAGGQQRASIREWLLTLGLTSRAMFTAAVDDLIQAGVIVKEVIGKGRGAETSFALSVDPPNDNTDIREQDFAKANEVSRSRSNVISFVAAKVNLVQHPFSPIVPDSHMLFKKSIRVGGRGPFPEIDSS